MQRATAYQSGRVAKATKLEEGMISNSAGEPEEEERKAEEEAREPNDMEEMREQIVDQCPGQVPLSGDPISPNGSASPELKRQTTPVVPSYKQEEVGESVREFAEPPYTRSRAKRNAGILAESLLRARASMERVFQAMKPATSVKRPLENPGLGRVEEKREKVDEEDAMEESEICSFEEEEEVAWNKWTRDLDAKEATQKKYPKEKSKMRAMGKGKSGMRAVDEGEPSSASGEETGVQIVKTVNLNHRLPKRVEERPVKRDHKGRPNIPILVGEAKLIKGKLDKGAKIVKKIIVFRASEDGPIVDAHAYIREESRGDDAEIGAEVVRLTKKLQCTYGDKVRLVEKVKEIVELVDEVGEEKTEEIREVIDQVAGWPSAKFNRIRGERLEEENRKLKEKLNNVEEELQRNKEELSACQAERRYAKSDVGELRKEVGRTKHTVGELMKALEESRVQSATLRAELGKRTHPGIAKQEAGVQVDGGKWNLIGKVRRHVGIQTEAAQPVTESRTVSILDDEGVGKPREEEEGINAVWKIVRQLQGRVDQLERGPACCMEERNSKQEEENDEPTEDNPRKEGTIGVINLIRPLLPNGIKGTGDNAPRVCVINVRGEEINRWRQKTGGQEIQFEISDCLKSCGVETSLGPTYKPEDGSYEWQLRWVPSWKEDKLVTWGVFTRLIGKLEGPVVEGEKTKVLKAYVKDGWKKEKQEVKQE